MNSLFEKIFFSVVFKSLNGWVVCVAKIGGFFNQTRSSLPVAINFDQTIATTAAPTKTVVLTFVPPPFHLGRQCPEASFWVCLIEKNNNNSNNNKLMTMMVMMICRYFCSVSSVDVSMWTLSVWLPDWLADDVVVVVLSATAKRDNAAANGNFFSNRANFVSISFHLGCTSSNSSNNS